MIKPGVKLLAYLLLILLYNSIDRKLFIFIETVTDLAKTMVIKLAFMVFLSLSKKLAEGFFDSQLFAYVGIHEQKVIEIKDKAYFENRNISRNQKSPCFNLIFEICLNLMESKGISYKANENRYEY